MSKELDVKIGCGVIIFICVLVLAILTLLLMFWGAIIGSLGAGIYLAFKFLVGLFL